MQLSRLWLLCALMTGLWACNPKPKAPTTSTTAESTPATWGGLSEDEFKALHELTGEQAPTLRGEMIEVGGAAAYLSLPQDAEPTGAVVVIHEWWGLNEHIKHWADRLAAAGYAAVAVDLYGGTVATTPDEAMAAMKKVDEQQAQSVLAAAHEFLAEDDRIEAEKRAVIGWCFGGAWSLKHALSVDDLDAAVIYYGRLVTDAETLKNIEAPVLGVFGNQDQGIPPETVDAFEAALEKAGVTHEIHRYDARHAFANPSSGRYDHASAEDAWKHVQAFLETHLTGGA